MCSSTYNKYGKLIKLWRNNNYKDKNNSKKGQVIKYIKKHKTTAKKDK
jgi:hypothetical protein